MQLDENGLLFLTAALEQNVTGASPPGPILFKQSKHQHWKVVRIAAKTVVFRVSAGLCNQG